MQKVKVAYKIKYFACINYYNYITLQNELDQVTAQLEQTDAKLLQVGAKNSSLEAQLAEANVSHL